MSYYELMKDVYLQIIKRNESIRLKYESLKQGRT